MNYGICDEAGKVIARFVVPTTVSSNCPVFSTDTLNLHRKTMLRGAQRWELKTNVEPLQATAEDLFVNLVTKGYHEEVTIKVPQNIGVITKLRDIADANTTLTISIGARSNPPEIRYGRVTLTVDPGRRVIPKGTLVTLGGDLKVYMLVGEIGPTSTSVDLFPQLLVTKNDVATLTYCGVTMRCKYDTDTIQGMVYQNGMLMDMGVISLVENLQ